MYYSTALNGSDLPAKTLCLTFDDGPGQHTLPIARFLAEHQIRATFFVVGKYAFHHPEILAGLKAMNHIIGNHTYDHPDMPVYLSVDGDVTDQVLRTDVLIKPYVADVVYFRPPYGKWSKEVTNELNQSMLTANHVGPIHWEIAGIDCYYWFNNWPVADAAKRYLDDIEQQQRGIVVMHDDIADMDVVKAKNQTLQLLQILIPQLLERGFQFVGLDEISSVKEASAQKDSFTLQNRNGKYLSLNNQDQMFANGQPENPQNRLQFQDLGYGKIAIKASNQLYWSIVGEAGLLSAKSTAIAPEETFDLINVSKNKLMLRAANGNYLTIEKSGIVSSSAKYMRQAEVFRYASHNNFVKNKVTLQQRFQLFKKQVLFIKSKLQQKL
ncbi:polysaccharide deacetylase family protein [Mucilaginibacter sp.]|uniref:polysaccharide deacetylase family protein n=1 Tax=Mucilaginibacter sp. TaxID=1882438 RepID=UPI003B003E40